jgi:hypothetical protein
MAHFPGSFPWLISLGVLVGTKAAGPLLGAFGKIQFWFCLVFSRPAESGFERREKSASDPRWGNRPDIQLMPRYFRPVRI